MYVHCASTVCFIQSNVHPKRKHRVLCDRAARLLLPSRQSPRKQPRKPPRYTARSRGADHTASATEQGLPAPSCISAPPRTSRQNRCPETVQCARTYSGVVGLSYCRLGCDVDWQMESTKLSTGGMHGGMVSPSVLDNGHGNPLRLRIRFFARSSRRRADLGSLLEGQ